MIYFVPVIEDGTLWVDPAFIAAVHESIRNGRPTAKLFFDSGTAVEVVDEGRTAVARIRDAKNPPLEHDWGEKIPDASGLWICKRCGKSATGGRHDGGGYYPERGQVKTYCTGAKGR